MSEKITTQELEKLLNDPQKRIELHKLVHDETEKVYRAIEKFSTQTTEVEGTAKKAIKDFEAITENLRLIVAYGAYFGSEDQAYLWNSALTRLGTLPHDAGSVLLLDIQLYPALLVMYAGGISAISAGNYTSLKSILSAETTSRTREPTPLPYYANCNLLKESANRLLELENGRKTGLSDYLHDLYEKTLPKELIFGNKFDNIFDRWEILLAMYVADSTRNGSHSWAPIGQFSWKNESLSNAPLNIMEAEIKNSPHWPPIQAGLFGGSKERVDKALAVLKEIVSKINFF